MKAAIAWFARNSVAANLLMLAMLAAGLLALPNLRQQVFPEMQLAMITVTVPYRGASPEEVEEAVCIRVEERLQGIEGIRRLLCSADEGVGVVTAELSSWADSDQVHDDIQTEVDAIDTFPAETERPLIRQAVIRNQVLSLAVAGDLEERDLRAIGRQVRDEIADLPEVTQVEIANRRPFEISIEVSEDALRRHALRFDDVVAAVSRGSLDLPAGSIKTSGGEVSLRTRGQAYQGIEYESLPILSGGDGSRLTLDDIADVVDGFEERDLSVSFDGQPAILIQVFRVGDQDTLEIATAVRRYVQQKRLAMPPGVTLTVWQDDAIYLRARLDTIIGNARTGFILVMGVLALFLRLRLAFWVGIGVPTAILATLGAMPALGLSLNLLTLYGFLIVLGVLVDDAIVIGENVHAHQERGGDPLDAAVAATQEVSVPVTFGVLTTVAAFSPLLFLPGDMGNLSRGIPIVVVAALAFSWIESKLVLPSHLGHLEAATASPDRSARGWARLQAGVSTALDRFTSSVYAPFLSRALDWRHTTLAAGVAALLITGGLIGGGWVRFVFFPHVEGDNVVAFVTFPEGTPATVTAAAVDQIVKAAEELRDDLDTAGASQTGSVFRHVLASVGEQPYRRRQTRDRFSSSVSSTDEGNIGEVNIELAPSEERGVTSEEIGRRWRDLTGEIPDTVELAFTSTYFSAGKPVHVELRGHDGTALRGAAAELRQRLRDYPGVYDITDSFRGGKREARLALRPGAEALGISLSDLATQVRHAFYGAEAQRIQRGRDDVRVMVRYPRSARRSLSSVDEMRIRTPDGVGVPFRSIAEIDYATGFAHIDRADRQRIVSVTAEVDASQAVPNEIVADLHGRVLPKILDSHPGVSHAFEGQQSEQQEFYGSTAIGFVVALLVIFALLAIPLGSYLQATVIMSAIPFGAMGAVWGHLLMGHDVSMFSVIGIVAVSGVVVNDSLVLIDRANRHRLDGGALLDAITTAGRSRLRPILLTSLTTFAGLTPMLLERSVQARMLIPVAISLAFGVLFATALTLVFVPALYVAIEDLRAIARPAESRGVGLELVDGAERKSA